MPSLDKLNLEEIPCAAWQLLREGVDSAKAPFHTPCLGTMGEFGPSLRTVVFRQCDEERRLIACHTDNRSEKVAELLEDSRGSWLFYDRELKLQLRLGGLISIHQTDELADDCWARTWDPGRACYNAPDGPGHLISEPTAAPAVITSPQEEQKARSRFSVLACRVDFIDWLLLSAHGHRRAQFNWNESGWQGNWVAP